MILFSYLNECIFLYLVEKIQLENILLLLLRQKFYLKIILQEIPVIA